MLPTAEEPRGDKKPSSDTAATLHPWPSLGLWRGRRFRPVGLGFMCIPAAISALPEVTKLPAWRSRRAHRWAMLAAVPRIGRRLSRLAHWRACSAAASCGRTLLPPPLPKFAAPTRAASLRPGSYLRSLSHSTACSESHLHNRPTVSLRTASQATVANLVAGSTLAELPYRRSRIMVYTLYTHAPPAGCVSKQASSSCALESSGNFLA